MPLVSSKLAAWSVCCYGDLRHEQAEEAETREAELEAQIKDYQLSVSYCASLSQVTTSLCMLSRANLICGYDLRRYIQDMQAISLMMRFRGCGQCGELRDAVLL
jgi:hypothetical protein